MRAERAGLQRAVNRSGRAAFALHLDHRRHRAPQILHPARRPRVRPFAHRRGRRDRINGDDFVQRVGDTRHRFVRIQHFVAALHSATNLFVTMSDRCTSVAFCCAVIAVAEERKSAGRAQERRARLRSRYHRGGLPMFVDTNPFLFQATSSGAMVRLSGSPIVNVTSGGGETGFFVIKRCRGTLVEILTNPSRLTSQNNKPTIVIAPDQQSGVHNFCTGKANRRGAGCSRLP